MSAAVSTASTPGTALAARGVDRADVGEGVRRAHEIGLRLAGQRHVGRIASEPAHQRIVLQPGLVVRAAFNGLRIHDDFRCGEGAVREWALYRISRRNGNRAGARLLSSL